MSNTKEFKGKNKLVLILRYTEERFLQPIKIDISQMIDGEIIFCPECLERVKVFGDHYQHESRSGTPCKFKTVWSD